VRDRGFVVVVFLCLGLRGSFVAIAASYAGYAGCTGCIADRAGKRLTSRTDC
jgi:hypothetical protein